MYTYMYICVYLHPHGCMRQPSSKPPSPLARAAANQPTSRAAAISHFSNFDGICRNGGKIFSGREKFSRVEIFSRLSENHRFLMKSYV